MSSEGGAELYNPLEQAQKEGSENGKQATVTSSAGGGGSGGEEQQQQNARTDICRDYMKNVCNRGTRCKFYHPPQAKQAAAANGGGAGGGSGATGVPEEIKFCIDYQNARGCFRDNCRFVHARKQVAEDYRRTQEVTLELARAIAGITEADNINGIPFCKEFLNGNCSRGGARCRYWHIDRAEERRRRMFEKGGGGDRVAPFEGYPDEQQHYGGGPRRDFAAPPMPRGGADLTEYYGGGGPGGGGIPPPSAVSAAFGGPPRGAFGVGNYRSPLTSAYVSPVAEGYAMKRPRYDGDMLGGGGVGLGGAVGMGVGGGGVSENSHLLNELRNATMKITEQTTELESLKRELTRERERYEDLYALFRQHQSVSHQTVVAPASFAPTAAQMQPQQQAGAGAATGGALMSGGGGAVADHRLSLSASMAGGAPAMHQTMAAMSSGPNDAAVHWSTMRR